MKYIEKGTWESAVQNGELREAIEELFEELRINCEIVDEKEPSKSKHIIRTLYYSVAWRRHQIMGYSPEKLQNILEELKLIRSYMKNEMRKIK